MWFFAFVRDQFVKLNTNRRIFRYKYKQLFIDPKWNEDYSSGTIKYRTYKHTNLKILTLLLMFLPKPKNFPKQALLKKGVSDFSLLLF